MNASRAAGARLGPYELGPAIGAGGMGEVYRARDPRLGRDVAIKILPPEVADDPDRLRRFEQEARAAAALNHPNILSVHDVGADNGVAYLVTELLEGRTLREAMPASAGLNTCAAHCASNASSGTATVLDYHAVLGADRRAVLADARLFLARVGAAAAAAARR